jgi:hypothetical protein
MTAVTPAPAAATGTGDRRDGVVFVVGCPRSGTTWLERMLVAHPRVVAFPGDESQLFSSLAGFARLQGPGGHAVAAAVRRYCDRLFASARAAGGHEASFVVDKTPAHVHELPFISRVYPEASFIHILRDGRDVARSLLEFEHGPDSIAGCAEMWRRAVSDAWTYGPQLHRFREVRYEQLLDDPVAGVCELLAWIGAPVDDEVRAAVASVAAVRVSQYNTTGQVGSGKWRSLGPAELATIHRIAGDILTRAGYD